jgi:antitoxin component of MazEF toxin-antitoxin module
MQPRTKVFRIFVVALVASLVLAACGGGTTGSTWFNLPSIGVYQQPDGTARVFGFNVGYVLPATLIQQLQAAGTQQLEVRAGYNGIFIYKNGEGLPYISWNADAVTTLQDLLRRMPTVPNNNLIANLLPWLRTVGMGVAINLPGAANVPRWTGETTAIAEQPQNPIGPFQISGVAFDETGNLYVGEIPGSQLGLAGPVLDQNTLNTIRSLGLDTLQVRTDPNNIHLSMNNRPLPGLAYDSRSLAAAAPLVSAFAPDAAPTLDTAFSTLQNAQIDATVSFSGPTEGQIALGAIPVRLNTDGTLAAFGAPIPGVALPADLLQQLQQAGVQTLNVDVGEEGIFLAANGQTLPTITWTPETLNTLAGVVAPLTGMDPAMLSSLLTIVRTSGGLQANIGIGDVEPVALEIDRTLQPASAEGAPVVRLNANVQNGSIQSIEGLGNLADLGMDPIALPPDVMQILGQLNARQVTINTGDGRVDVQLDGNTALTINWDVPSILTTLQLAGPFLAGTPLEDPNVARLVTEQIVPLLPGADVDVTLNLN